MCAFDLELHEFMRIQRATVDDFTEMTKEENNKISQLHNLRENLLQIMQPLRVLLFLYFVDAREEKKIICFEKKVIVVAVK